MIVPNCHAGVNERSYVSFHNRETADALKRIDLDNGRLFSISDRLIRKSRRILRKGQGFIFLLRNSEHGSVVKWETWELVTATLTLFVVAHQNQRWEDIILIIILAG